MAAHQCPNCGGYKTYSWWSTFSGQVIGAVVLTVVLTIAFGGLGLLLAPVLVWACWFKKPAGRRPHYCRICEYAWDVSSASASGAAAPRPGLLHLGNALLEHEAAAAAEEDRQRRSRGA